jgi:hypothetical protein
LCINWLKKFRKDIKYLLSFSDGKEGNVGYIYQATNWTYLGFRVSDSFYKLDNVVYHSVQVWHLYKEKHPDRDTKTTHEILFDNFNNVSKISSKQHIYVMPLVKGLPFVPKPYPKKDTELRILNETFLKREGVVLGKPEFVDYTKKFKHAIHKPTGSILLDQVPEGVPEQQFRAINHNDKTFYQVKYTKENAEVLNSLGYAVSITQALHP